jgi:hypothetical protein
LTHAGRYGEAVQSLQQCLAIKPDFSRGQVMLEQANQGLKNLESGRSAD